MTLTTVAVAARAGTADAMQAVYYRKLLDDQRQLLLSEIANRSAEVVRQMRLGQVSAIGRLRSQIRTVEDEVQSLDRLLNHLDRRFARDEARQH